MCEIAVTPVPANDDQVDSVVGVAKLLYKENSHGLGIVAVHTDGERFRYRVMKCGYDQEPAWDSVGQFVGANDDAWRLIIHARIATAGEHTATNTHPLSLSQCDDENVPWQYVVHNGVVRRWEAARDRFEDEGHYFHTDVDSEVIAHDTEHPTPEEFEEEEWEPTDLTGRLNYLLLGHDGILIGNTGKYTVTDDFQIACVKRNWISEDDGDSNSKAYRARDPSQRGWSYITPDGERRFRKQEFASTVYSGSTYGYARTFGTTTPASRSRSAQTRWGASATQSQAEDSRPRGKRAGTDSTAETEVSQDETTSPTYEIGVGETESHWGWFTGAEDYDVCREHGSTFLGTCDECVAAGYSLSEIPLDNTPDFSKQSETAIITREGDFIQLYRCPHNGHLSVSEKCPDCGREHDTAHNARQPYYRADYQ